MDQGPKMEDFDTPQQPQVPPLGASVMAGMALWFAGIALIVVSVFLTPSISPVVAMLTLFGQIVVCVQYSKWNGFFSGCLLGVVLTIVGAFLLVASICGRMP